MAGEQRFLMWVMALSFSVFGFACGEIFHLELPLGVFIIPLLVSLGVGFGAMINLSTINKDDNDTCHRLVKRSRTLP